MYGDSISSEIYEVVQKFQAFKPETYYDVKDMGFKLRSLGSGVFRQGFRLIGYPLIVKIPLEESDCEYETGLEHSLREIKTIQRINTQVRFKALRPFMPEVYYHNKQGVILMKYYDKLPRGGRDQVINILGAAIESAADGCSENGLDLHYDNVRVEVKRIGDSYYSYKEYHYKVIDLGYVL